MQTPLAPRCSISDPVADELAHDWTLALAGGEGTRLQDYVVRRFGAAIPKQYCRLVGSRSMLEHTLDRMNSRTPPSRTMTVIGAAHREWAAPQLAGRSDHMFCQPASRDTAVALYVALAMITRWHPNAIVTVVPTGHYIAPASRYLAAIALAQDTAAKMRDLVVLLAVSPTDPDPDLEYIVLGPAMNGAIGVHGVRALVDKPTAAGATKLRDGGALSSMTVVCGSVAALWELGRAAEPQLIDILDSLVPLIGTEDEPDAIDYIYRSRLPVSFARDICERAPQRIVALPITGIEWIDLATPDRIERVKALVSD